MISNLRDLGGMTAADGKKIRSGMLVRSASLTAAEPEDLNGISAVIDLRTAREREERPDLFYDAEYLPIPVFEQITAGISHEEEASERAIPGMAGLYALLIRDNADQFRKIVTAIMEHDFSTGAVLWHCSEGKDRCGMTTSLILEILGVSREDIMEDYMKTNIVNLPKAELEQFAGDVMERFRNPFVKHFVTSIMLNSFPKFKTRDLPGLKTYLDRKGELPKGLVLGLAGICTYYKGGKRGEDDIVPNDDPKILDLLKDLWATGDVRKVATGVLADDFIWGEDLNAIPGLTDLLVADLALIQAKGMREAVKSIL